VRALAKNLLKLWPALWTFADVDDVEPTNNAAERGLRAAVIYGNSRFRNFCRALFRTRTGDPNLPCDPNGNGGQRLAKVGRYLKPLSAVRRGERLQRVAPSLFHDCSIPIGPKRAI
jgi:hypothetical protein